MNPRAFRIRYVLRRLVFWVLGITELYGGQLRVDPSCSEQDHREFDEAMNKLEEPIK